MIVKVVVNMVMRLVVKVVMKVILSCMRGFADRQTDRRTDEQMDIGEVSSIYFLKTSHIHFLLVILVIISTSTKSFCMYIKFYCSQINLTMIEEEFHLTWNNYSDHMKKMLHYLMTSQTLSDVTLVCDDKILMEAHKIILISCSKFFEAILHPLTQSSDCKPIIYLKGINHQEMESILQFMYLGEARFSQERTSEFLRVATELELKSICKIDENNMQKEISMGDNTNELCKESVIDTLSEDHMIQSNESGKLEFNSIDCDEILDFQKPGNSINYDKMCSEETFGIESPKLENSNESNEQQSKQTKEVEVAAQYSQLQPIEINKYTPKVPLDIRDDLDVRRAIDNLNKWKSKKSGSKKETSFFCPLCALKYSNKKNLERHMESKHPELLPDRVCPHCKDFITKDLEILKSHMITEHRDQCPECKKCKVAFHLSKELFRHNRKVHNETHYICDVCNSTFVRRAAFQMHQADFHNMKHFCVMCDYSTRTENLLHLHTVTYHDGEGRKFQCSQCKRKFLNNSSLLGHIRFTHDHIRINCELCDFKATNKTQVREHILRVHAGVTIFCPVCNGEFGSKATLHEHMKSIHSDGEKTVICDHCDKKFQRNSDLKKHTKRTHLKIKKHECSKCNFLAFSKNEVDKHEITHLSKMKVCDKCEKQYKHNHTYKK